MRATLIVSALAVGTMACGAGGEITAPGPTELQLTMTVSPDAVPGVGLRSSSILSVTLFAPHPPGEVSPGGVLQSAVFTVRDAQGTVLTRETVTGPILFERGAPVGLQQTLTWAGGDVFGRSLNVRFMLAGADPVVIDRTVTF